MTIDDIHKAIEQKVTGIAEKYGYKFSYNTINSQGTGKLERKTDQVIFRFGYGITDNGNEFEIGSGYGKITFPVVEEITIPILVKHDILGQSALLEPTTFVPPNQEIVPEMRITTADNLDKFTLLYTNCFEEKILPLFKQYRDLTTVSNYLNDVPQKEVRNYIPKGVYKKATIWKLCGNRNYEEYINWLHEGMTKRAKNNPENADYAKASGAIKELKEKLSNTPIP